MPYFERFESFAFDFRDEPETSAAQLEGIGCDLRRESGYDWNGMERAADNGKCIFQYTLSGTGMFEAGGEKRRLEAGQAFLVTAPSEHRYYIPYEGCQWEFLFIVLSGTETKKTFDSIIAAHGHIIDLDPESPVIHYLTELQNIACKGLLGDGYLASACAYRFNMELLRTIRCLGEDADTWGPAVTKAAAFIRSRYADPLSIEEIAAAVELSKYHFCKQFRKTTGYTPLDYVTKIRLDKARELLLHTSDSIEKIAQLIGYSSGNYFCKVFRKWTGQSPGGYRSSERIGGQPVSYYAKARTGRPAP